jgi:hypothetical protein
MDISLALDTITTYHRFAYLLRLVVSNALYCNKGTEKLGVRLLMGMVKQYSHSGEKFSSFLKQNTPI